MKRVIFLLAGLLAVGLVAAGCSKSEKPPETTGTPKPVTAIEVTDAWARESIAMADSGAIYMTIKNAGTADDKLLSASVSPEVAAIAELHETTAAMTPTATMSPATGAGSTAAPTGGMEHKSSVRLSSHGAAEGDHSKSEIPPTPTGGMAGDHSSGMTKMQEVHSISIPSGKTVKLEPGGYHIMLMKLAKPLKAGDSIQVTLTFENAGKKEVEATIREA